MTRVAVGYCQGTIGKSSDTSASRHCNRQAWSVNGTNVPADPKEKLPLGRELISRA